jgi:Aldo/keto reductase family
MEYVKLGRTGLEVSRICLGCMSYGVPDRGNHAWSIGEEDSRPFIKRALEGGINFFDTANRYSLGSSEEILGRAIKDFARRDEVVIATKVYGRMRPGPNGGGLSRKAIMREVDDSLRRLGTVFIRSTAGTMAPRSKRPLKRCTTSSRPERSVISAHLRCMHGSSRGLSGSPNATAGLVSSACRIW